MRNFYIWDLRKWKWYYLCLVQTARENLRAKAASVETMTETNANSDVQHLGQQELHVVTSKPPAPAFNGFNWLSFNECEDKWSWTNVLEEHILQSDLEPPQFQLPMVSIPSFSFHCWSQELEGLGWRRVEPQGQHGTVWNSGSRRNSGVSKEREGCETPELDVSMGAEPSPHSAFPGIAAASLLWCKPGVLHPSSEAISSFSWAAISCTPDIPFSLMSTASKFRLPNSFLEPMWNRKLQVSQSTQNSCLEKPGSAAEWVFTLSSHFTLNSLMQFQIKKRLFNVWLDNLWPLSRGNLWTEASKQDTFVRLNTMTSEQVGRFMGTKE